MSEGKSLTPELREQKVVEILQKGMQFNDLGGSLQSIRYDTPIADLAIDSLLLSELIFDLEDSFGIQLSDAELMDLTASETIGDFIKFFLKCCDRSTSSSPFPLEQQK